MSMEASRASDRTPRLPLPLAQLLRRAEVAKSPLERCRIALDVWQCAVRLLGTVAAVEFAERRRCQSPQDASAAYALRLRPFHHLHDPLLVDRLACLVRPTLAHWWETARTLTPAVAATGDAAFQAIRDHLFGKAANPMRSLAALEQRLRRGIAQDHRAAGPAARLSELFDQLVELCQSFDRPSEHGNRPWVDPALADTTIDFVMELLESVDFMAGRRLTFVSDVRRMKKGSWLIERLELTGCQAMRIETVELAQVDESRLPRVGCVYLESVAPGPHPSGMDALARPVSPFVAYSPGTEEFWFLRAQPGKSAAEYVCFTTGAVAAGPAWQGENAAFLARLLDTSVDTAKLHEWMNRCCAEDPTIQERPAFRFKTLGTFELLSEQSRGPAGVLYRAWQPSVRRQVALECSIRPGDPKIEGELQHWTKALACVVHPHLASTYSMGTEGDVQFVASEAIDGASLAAVVARFEPVTHGKQTTEAARWAAAVRDATLEQRKVEKLVCERMAYESRVDSLEGGSAAAAAAIWPGYVQKVIELGRQAAAAAHALHEAGLLHRNLRPDQMWLTFDLGELVLAAPPVAALTDAVEGRLTRTHQLGEALRFMSPEQALSVAPIDGRADVYSLGASLWELLALQPMFGVTAQTPTSDILYRVQYEAPEPLSRYCPSIPSDLERVIHKCLAKEPGQRFATAAEFADALANFANEETWLPRPAVPVRPPVVESFTPLIQVSLAPPEEFKPEPSMKPVAVTSPTPPPVAAPSPGVAEPWPRQSRILLGAGVSFAVLFAAAIVWFGLPGIFRFNDEAATDPGPQQPVPLSVGDNHQEVERLRGLLEAEKRRADGLTGEVRKSAVLAATERVRAEALAAEVSTWKQRAEEAEKRNTGAQPEEVKKLLARIEADSQRMQALEQDAARLKDRADAYAAELERMRQGTPAAAGNPAFLAFDKLFNELAQETAWRSPAFEPLRKRLHLAMRDSLMQIAAKATALTPEEEGRLQMRLGWVQFELGARKEAEAAYDKTLALLKRSVQAQGQNAEVKELLAALHDQMGQMYRAMSVFEKAQASFGQAALTWEALSKEHTEKPDYLLEHAAVQDRLGLLFQDAEKLQDAEAAFQKSLSIRDQGSRQFANLPQFRDELAQSHHNLGMLHEFSGGPERAEKFHQQGIAIREKLVSDHPKETRFAVNLAIGCLEQGGLLQDNGNAEAALTWYTKSIDTLAKVFDAEARNPKARRTLSKAYRNRAQVLSSLNRPADALQDWDAALAYEDQDTVALRSRRALTLVQLGDHARAVSEAELLLRTNSASASVQYNAACVYSLASEGVRRDRQLSPMDQARLADQFAKRAVDLLQTAHQAGYFKDANRLNTLRTDTDLNPLRAREDFRKLMGALQP